MAGKQENKLSWQDGRFCAKMSVVMSAGRTEDRWKRSIQINETKKTIYAEDDRRVAAREMLQSSGL